VLTLVHAVRVRARLRGACTGGAGDHEDPTVGPTGEAHYVLYRRGAGGRSTTEQLCRDLGWESPKTHRDTRCRASHEPVARARAAATTTRL
jgi:hypothetical protein